MGVFRYPKKLSLLPYAWATRAERFFSAERQTEGTRATQSAGGTLPKRARMREYGSVNIPQEAFIAALRMGEE